MNEHLNNILTDKYPNLSIIDHRDGWFSLTNAVMHSLKCALPDEIIHYDYIEQKEGLLRVDCYSTRDLRNCNVTSLISGLAEMLSGRYCELCGQIANTVSMNDWLTTACEDCLDRQVLVRNVKPKLEPLLPFELTGHHRETLLQSNAIGLIRNFIKSIEPNFGVMLVHGEQTEIDFPPVMYPLVEVIVRAMMSELHFAKIERISWTTNGGLHIGFDPEFEQAAAASMFIRHLSHSINLRTGGLKVPI